jgi:PAS domain S-box-containing protein
LEQLLEVYERTVRVQSDRLEQAMLELRARAEELARSEAALRRQTRLLELIVRTMNDGLIVTDESGKFVLFNSAARNIVGHGPDDIPPEEWPTRYGIFLSDGLTPAPAAQLPLVRAMNGESVCDIELFVRNAERPAGVWVNVDANPLLDETGASQGSVCVFRNITQHKLAEKSIRDSEALYHSLVDTLPLSVLRKDRNGRFTYANKVFCSLMGKPIEEIVGHTDFELYPADLADKYVRDDRRVIESGMVFDDIEENQGPDGTRHYVQVIKAPVRDSEQNIVGVQVIFWDVTDRKRAEQQLTRTAAELARSNRELESFAYVASHDLQEPLRTVAGYLQLLRRRYGGGLGPEADEFISFAVNAADRMQHMIHDLLIYARVATRTQPLQPSSGREAFAKATENLSRTIAEHGATITCDALPNITGDPTQLVQLFQNLISNAIKFHGEEPPRVHISSRLDKGRWHFTVCDNGIGIDPQYANKLFGLFERLHAKDRYPGSGIGLATCKRIVERHGGQIWIESAPCCGCTVHFTLPAD